MKILDEIMMTCRRAARTGKRGYGEGEGEKERECKKKETEIETRAEVTEMGGDAVREKRGHRGRVLKRRGRNSAGRGEVLEKLTRRCHRRLLTGAHCDFIYTVNPYAARSCLKEVFHNPYPLLKVCNAVASHRQHPATPSRARVKI